MFVEQVRQDTNLRVIVREPVTEADWEARYVRAAVAKAIEHEADRRGNWSKLNEIRMLGPAEIERQ